MATAADVQDVIRFLVKDAKVALATAIKAAGNLRDEKILSVDAIATSKPEALASVFDDAKLAKQVINAAKRSQKKRAALETHGDVKPPASKKPKQFSDAEPTPAELEAALDLPLNEATEEELSQCILRSNRAPLMVAFVVQLLKYTMPEQPLSSRLSLAHAVMSTNARTKAVSIGLESGKSAEEDGWGQGQPMVKIMNRELRVMKRYGYEWRPTIKTEDTGSTDAIRESTIKTEDDNDDPSNAMTASDLMPQSSVQEDSPLWAIDLEAVKRQGAGGSSKTGVGLPNNLPIYRPQAAKDYLEKSFDRMDTTASLDNVKAKQSAAKTHKNTAKDRLRNLGMLLEALDQVYASWISTIEAEELDHRAWQWYCRVRPNVAEGQAGWGGKGEVRLGDILALKRNG